MTNVGVQTDRQGKEKNRQLADDRITQEPCHLRHFIPAKAGIHFPVAGWIPAYAGMTNVSVGMTNARVQTAERFSALNDSVRSDPLPCSAGRVRVGALLLRKCPHPVLPPRLQRKERVIRLQSPIGSRATAAATRTRHRNSSSPLIRFAFTNENVITL